MDEESSMSNSFDDQENDENLDKENQRRRDLSDETNEQQRYIFEQQQLQRSQYYEQQQQTYHRDQTDQSPIESHDELMNDELMNDELMNDELMNEDSNDLSSKLVNESVPDYLVEKIDKERWPGVNGHYDDNGIWREWNEMFGTKNEYSNEQFIILPYVCTSTIDYVSLDISC